MERYHTMPEEEYRRIYKEIYDRVYSQAYHNGYEHGREDGYNTGYEHALKDHLHNEKSHTQHRLTDKRWHGHASKSWSWL